MKDVSRIKHSFLYVRPVRDKGSTKSAICRTPSVEIGVCGLFALKNGLAEVLCVVCKLMLECLDHSFIDPSI